LDSPREDIRRDRIQARFVENGEPLEADLLHREQHNRAVIDLGPQRDLRLEDEKSVLGLDAGIGWEAG
jgi:hypothetical protein